MQQGLKEITSRCHSSAFWVPLEPQLRAMILGFLEGGGQELPPAPG